MKRKFGSRPEMGQSLAEFALLLPLLLLFILGTAEVGFALYNYMSVAGANREGVRLASRGRFEDNTVVARVISAGGLREVTPGVVETNLRTIGTSPNLGVIITRISIPYASGQPIQITTFVSGTLAFKGPSGMQVRPITADDGRFAKMTPQELLAYLNVRRDVAAQINDYKLANDYDITSNEVYVVVETFYAHESLTKLLLFIDDPLTLTFASTMRVLQDGRVD